MPVDDALAYPNVTAGSNGRLVAVGTGDRIYTCTPAEGFVARSSPTTRNLCALTYTDGRFLAGGSAGTLLTSTDGLAWRLETVAYLHFQTSAAFGNGVFVLPGHADRVISSADAVSWNAASLLSPQNLDCAAFGHGLLVLGSHGLVLTTPDGRTFIPVLPPTKQSLRAAPWFGGQFVTTGGARPFSPRPTAPTRPCATRRTKRAWRLQVQALESPRRVVDVTI